MTGPTDDERGRPPDDAFADLLNGFTFDSGRRRGRKRKVAAEQAQHAAELLAQEAVERQGDSWPDTDDDAGPPREVSENAMFDEHRDPVDELSGTAAIVRPYAWTRGRTKANQHLELETLVSTSDSGWNIQQIRHVEHRTVAELCKHPHAVAEVAAKLSVPLGVARVLLSDMAEQGLITVHQTVAEDDDTAAQLMLMERVLSGLRRL